MTFREASKRKEVIVNREPIRQGDVLLIPVDAAPQGAVVARDRGQLVLAYGEATGHAHVIDAPPETAVLTEAENRRFLRLMEQAELVHGTLTDTSVVRLPHDEHAPLTVPAGTYLVVGQREWSAGMARQVVD